MMEITTNNSIRVNPEIRDRDISMMSFKLVWTFDESFVQNGLSEVGCVMGSMEFFLPPAKEFSAHHSLRFL
jgi:hypothetical protein